MFKNLSIVKKVLILSILPVLLSSIVLTIVQVRSITTSTENSIEVFEKKVYESKQELLKDNIAIAIKTIESFYERTSKEKIEAEVEEKLKLQMQSLMGALQGFYEENKNRLNEGNLLNSLKEIVKNARYGEDGYFWINDKEPKMIMHPIKPQLDGVFLGNSQDPNGKKLFNAMVEEVKSDGEGFVDYQWEKPGFETPQDKISYVAVFEPLGWIIGTGAYVDNVTSQIQEEAKKTIAAMRFGEDGNNYFWINDLKPNMVMHPIKPELDGKYIGEAKDPNGKALFMEMVKEAKNNGKGFVDYQWPKPGFDTPQDKISYIELFKPWGWIIGTGVYIDDIQSDINAMREKGEEEISSSTFSNILATAVVLFIAIVLTVITTNSAILKPISSLKETMKSLSAQGGDLTIRLPIYSKDEIGESSQYMNEFIQKVHDIIEDAHKSSTENMSISTELSGTTHSVGQRAEESNQLIENAHSKGKNVAVSLEDTVKDSVRTKETLIDANSDLIQAKSTVLTMVEDIHRSAERENELAETLAQLSQDAEQVKGVLTVISDIAEQTNLLALNAAIEAARAGEHGRGFAVVADEVRKLAERTQKSLTEINSTISIIVQSIIDTGTQMNQNAKDIQDLSSASVNVEGLINKTSEVMESAVREAESSLKRAEKTTQAAKEIIKSVEDVNTITASNARSIEEIAEASQHLSNMTQTLNQQLERFKI